MKAAAPRYYYLFKGNWSDRFNELEKMVETGKIAGFELWVPRDKTRSHEVIVVYGRPLTMTYSVVKSVWETSEAIFSGFFAENEGQFDVHTIGSTLEKEKSE